MLGGTSGDRAVRAGLRRHAILLPPALAVSVAFTLCGAAAESGLGHEALKEIERVALFGLPETVNARTGGPATASALRGRDPYARWIRAERLSGEASRQFGFLAASEDGRYIAKPRAGGPFARQGVDDAVELLAVNDRWLGGKGLREIKAIIAAAPETSVFHLRQLGTGAERVITVMREVVERPLPAVERRGDLWLIDLHDLEEGAADTFDAERTGFADGRPVVLDLRYNSGGDLLQAVAVLSRFVGPGRAGQSAVTVHRHGQVPYSLPVADADIPGIGPVYLLTSSITASAAEVIAIALRTLGEARIVGGPTFGKCLAQQTLGYTSGNLVLSTAELVWLGRKECVPGVGVRPDIPAPRNSVHRTAVLLAIVEKDAARNVPASNSAPIPPPVFAPGSDAGSKGWGPRLILE